MKQEKMAVALASVSLAACGGALAQSNVTIYGMADVGVSIGNYGNGTRTQIQSGQQSGSRLGFRGEEDLGGGLKALFLLESGIAFDTGTNNQGGLPWGRQIFAGVSGSFGTLTLGRQYNPLDTAFGLTDAFEAGLNASSNAATKRVPGFQSRWDNSVRYKSPNWGGFYVDAEYSTSLNGNAGQESATSTGSANNDKAGRGWGMTFNYGAGPLFLTTGYLDTLAAYNATSGAAIVTTNDVKTKEWMVGGTYNFQVAKLFAHYASGKTDSNAGQLAKRDGWALGVQVPFGPHKIVAQHLRLNDKLAPDSDFRVTGIGYQYYLSKRTNLYASYAKGIPGSKVAYPLGSGASNDLIPVAGYKLSNVMIGMRHQF